MRGAGNGHSARGSPAVESRLILMKATQHQERIPWKTYALWLSIMSNKYALCRVLSVGRVETRGLRLQGFFPVTCESNENEICCPEGF